MVADGLVGHWKYIGPSDFHGRYGQTSTVLRSVSHVATNLMSDPTPSSKPFKITSMMESVIRPGSIITFASP